MKQNQMFGLLAFALLQSCIFAGPTGSRVLAVQRKAPCSQAASEAAAEAQLPPLIQATTLESDYKAMTGLGLAFTSLSSRKDPGQAFENILCSCVRLQAGGHYGSGSIFKLLENEIIIVSNRHVLQYWNEDSYVTFFNGAVMRGALLGLSEETDAGFLCIPTVNFTYQELLKYRNVRTPAEAAAGKSPDVHTACTEGMAEGSGIFFVDMATDWREPVRLDGEVIAPLIDLEDFQTEMLYGKGEAVPGMSGSGVFDDYGNYAGMLTGGTLQGEIAALPVQVICEEYEKIVSE